MTKTLTGEPIAPVPFGMMHSVYEEESGFDGELPQKVGAVVFNNGEVAIAKHRFPVDADETFDLEVSIDSPITEIAAQLVKSWGAGTTIQKIALPGYPNRPPWEVVTMLSSNPEEPAQFTFDFLDDLNIVLLSNPDIPSIRSVAYWQRHSQNTMSILGPIISSGDKEALSAVFDCMETVCSEQIRDHIGPVRAVIGTIIAPSA